MMHFSFFRDRCQNCLNSTQIIPSSSSSVASYRYALNCADCYTRGALNPFAQPLYESIIDPLNYTVSVFLPVLYIIGMFFSLKTHYRFIDQENAIHAMLHKTAINQEPEPAVGTNAHAFGKRVRHSNSVSILFENVEDHDHLRSESTDSDGPRETLWSKKFCMFVLISSLALFGAIIEKVAQSIPSAIQNFNFTAQFSAVTILSWAPAVPDLVLAILFARQNDVSAAIDVGVSACLTITM
jgi:Ca2+/H+ antiporter